MRRNALLILIIFLIGTAFALILRKRPVAPVSPGSSFQQMAGELDALVARENELNKTLFAPELRAQELFAKIENFWENILRKPATLLQEFQQLGIEKLILPNFNQSQAWKLGINLHTSSVTNNLSAAAALDLVQTLIARGWTLEMCEFRHNKFTPGTVNDAVSRVYFAAHLRSGDGRATLDGDLIVYWKGTDISSVDASGLSLRTALGKPAFELDYSTAVSPPKGSYFIDPLIIADLDQNGAPEVILAAANLVLQRKAISNYAAARLTADDLRLIFTATLGDFSGNGTLDLLTARFEGLYLYEGSSNGAFETQGKLVWNAQPRLTYAQAITCGDIDADGDLDLFLGQYKPPFSLGQMPTPYYDANDGYPSFLLRNDGTGNFTDITQSAGLGAKRWRRLYSASLADLDGDRDLDLLTVSDFAGIDAFQNDGKGQFNDVSSPWFNEAKGLGMSHLIADLNNDSRLDVMMIGMNSPTVDRLDALGIVRPGAHDAEQRKALTFGNRIFLRTDGGYEQAGLSSITRTGWSWGAAASDLDGDGFPEICITNGHESKAHPREYEPEFWLHDIYAANSQTNMVTTAYFQKKMQDTRAKGVSYGGYEINRLYLNDRGTNFIEAAHLLGVASQADSRNVAFADLDGDGAEELIFTTFEVWPEVKQMLYIYRNTIASKPINRVRSTATGNGYRTEVRLAPMPK